MADLDDILWDLSSSNERNQNVLFNEHANLKNIMEKRISVIKNTRFLTHHLAIAMELCMRDDCATNDSKANKDTWLKDRFAYMVS